MAKRKISKTDGLGPYEKAKLRTAIRQVWHRSHARQLCVKRCTGEDGFSFCEQCGKIAPKITIDHITPAGEVNTGFIERMFCPSNELKGLCKECHRAKTNAERRKKQV